MKTVSKKCHKCNRSFRVLEDEQFDHHCPHCPHCGPEEIHNSYGDDVMGDELKKR
jgi:Zn finger protein HypA/HybF involved in hydrogenase expression